MKRSYVLSILIGLLVFFTVELHGEKSDSSYENRVENVDYIDPEVAETVIKLVNSLEKARIKKSYKEVAEMQAKFEKGDTTLAEQIFSRLPKSMTGNEYLVVVNTKHNRAGRGFTIYVLPEGKDPNVFCVGGLWPANRLRAFGYTKYLGYKVLFADIYSGRSYFTIHELDKNLPPKVYEILSKYRDELPILSYEKCISAEQLTEESGRVFIYNDVDGRLVNVSGPLPMLKAIDRGAGIRHPRSE